LGTFRRLCAEEDCLELVSTGFATVFENRHELLQLQEDRFMARLQLEAKHPPVIQRVL
jgi:hypothetical protein